MEILVFSYTKFTTTIMSATQTEPEETLDFKKQKP